MWILKLVTYVKILEAQLPYQQIETNQEAAAIREDDVLLRLRSLAVDQHFCYHMGNQCYKQDTLNKTDIIKVTGSIMFLFI